MAFKKTKQEALDLLQEKEKRLAELTEESAYAVQMVQNTIDNLQAVNSDIQTTMDEIDTYMQGIKYTENNSVDEMLSLGISQVPVLSVNNKLLDFSTANDWVNQQ